MRTTFMKFCTLGKYEVEPFGKTIIIALAACSSIDRMLWMDPLGTIANMSKDRYIQIQTIHTFMKLWTGGVVSILGFMHM